MNFKCPLNGHKKSFKIEIKRINCFTFTMKIEMENCCISWQLFSDFMVNSPVRKLWEMTDGEFWWFVMACEARFAQKSYILGGVEVYDDKETNFPLRIILYRRKTTSGDFPNFKSDYQPHRIFLKSNMKEKTSVKWKNMHNNNKNFCNLPYKKQNYFHQHKNA